MGDWVSVSLDSIGVQAWEDQRAPGVSPHSEVGVVEGVHAVDVEGRALRGDPPGLPGRWTVEQGSGPEVPGGPATVALALSSAWPEPRKKLPPRTSRLDRHKEAIDRILRADLDAPRKQRHTTKGSRRI